MNLHCISLCDFPGQSRNSNYKLYCHLHVHAYFQPHNNTAEACKMLAGCGPLLLPHFIRQCVQRLNDPISKNSILFLQCKHSSPQCLIRPSKSPPDKIIRGRWSSTCSRFLSGFCLFSLASIYNQLFETVTRDSTRWWREFKFTALHWSQRLTLTKVILIIRKL